MMIRDIDAEPLPGSGGSIKPHVIRRFFDEMSKKYNVDIDSLNVHITNGQIYVQKYTPGHVDMFKLLEIVE